MSPLPCVRCGKELPSVDEPQEHIDDSMCRIPSGGVVFQAHGNYGSALFDPLPDMTGRRGRYLEIDVCDMCLAELAEEGKVNILEVQERERYYEVNSWLPGDEPDR